MTADQQNSSNSSRYAVIGQPIEHSLSPLIHTHFAALADQQLSYDLLASPADGFVNSATAFFDAGGAGLNVTLPFKEQAQSFVSRCDEASMIAGAVNTIRRVSDGTLEGFNTDGIGLIRDVQDNLGWQLEGAKVLLIGAGGASRGVLDALLRASPESVTLANRTLERAAALVADVAPDNDRVRVCAPAKLTGSFDVVINATSASLSGQGALVPTESVHGARCYDMLYAPQQTVFAGWALSHGAVSVSDGLGMLLEQAAEAFCVWRNVRPQTGELLKLRAELFAAKRAGAVSLKEFLADPSDSQTASDVHSLSADTELSETVAKPRFIAGAVCPQCREVDRLLIREVVQEDGLGREQVCVACGFTQPETNSGSRGAQTIIPLGKPEQQPRRLNAEPDVQAVRFIDAAPSSSSKQGDGLHKNHDETD